MKKYFITLEKLSRQATKICNNKWDVAFKKFKDLDLDNASQDIKLIKPMILSYVPLGITKLLFEIFFSKMHYSREI